MGSKKITSYQNLYLISAALSNILFYAFLIPAALLYPGYSPERLELAQLEKYIQNAQKYVHSSCSIIDGV